MNNPKPYPYTANFDDQIGPLVDDTFYIFSLGERQFEWREISPKTPEIACFDKIFKLSDGTVFVDNYQITDQLTFDDITVKKAATLQVETIAPLRGIHHISNDVAASIKVNGKTSATFYDFELRVVSAGERVYFNGQCIDQLAGEFAIGDRLLIGGIQIERRPQQFKITGITAGINFNRHKIKVEPFIPEYPTDFPDYRRSPRIIKTPPTATVKVTPPKPHQTPEKGTLIKTILPPIMMVGMSVGVGIFTGGNLLMTLATGATAVVTASFSVSSYFTNRKVISTANAERDEAYDQYLIGKQAELRKLALDIQSVSEYHFPGAEKLMKMLQAYSARIYEKRPQNVDFLEVSLGFGTGIPSYKIEFEIGDEPDELALFTRDIIDDYRTLDNMPIPIKLQHETVGLIGVYATLKIAVQTILLQLAAFHSYKDLEMIALIPNESFAADFKDWRWLPHFKMEALNLRGLIHNERTRDMVLNSFYQLITKRKNALAEDKDARFSPHYILTILDDNHLAGHGLNEYLAEDMSQYGVTVIWCKESQAQLPETVTTMVEYYSSQAGVLVNQNGHYINKNFTPYQLPKQITVAQAISRLANLNHVEVEKNAIPKSVTFLEMYKAKTLEKLDVLTRWQQADSSTSLAVPLGLRGRDDVVELNLHERAHGPHGLVAGTTGSGKSEIVQSYILSLAVNFSPEDFGFLVIDFKGGGMANEFANLPHLMGAITNLDGAASARALASIQAELKKRQSEFGKYGVNHINGYTKLYKKGKSLTEDARAAENLPSKPIPHLFLISDEFAELKANEPEFMAELVSVARIGRSLGVHLILATQKPSGVVDDQIWSNSRFKLALKVADESDSNEIIKTPDAARITEPGRAYLQVGNNEIYELFQSAWSGADYDPEKSTSTKIDDRVWLINELGQYELLPTKSNFNDDQTAKKEDLPTELRAIVDYIDDLVQNNNVVIPDKPWLAPLAEQIISEEINSHDEWKNPRNLTVNLGLMDFPDQQKQASFTWHLETDKHTAIYGSSGFGKSTILQTIAMALAQQNTPEQIQFNLLDFGTNGLLPLKNLPHTVDLARAEDAEKLEKFLNLIKTEIANRKALFTEKNVASLAQYEAKTGNQLPVIVTIVDAYDNIKDNQNQGMTVDETLQQLLRDGANIGMYLLITALRPQTFRMNISGNIPTKIALYFNDETDLIEIVGRDRLIQQEIRGRAQIKTDVARSLQIYLPSAGTDDFDRLQNLDTKIADINTSWTGKRPQPIPMLPAEITMDCFLENPEVKDWLVAGNLPLGFSTATTVVRGYQPQDDAYFLIADNEPSQTEYLRATITAGFKVLKQQYHRVVVDASGEFENHHDVFDEIIDSRDFADKITTWAKQKIPSLIYIPNINDLANNIILSTDDFAQILRSAKADGLHFIFHGDKSKINGFDNLTKQLQHGKCGLVGSRMADQNFVRVKPNFAEPQPEHNEHHYFNGRFIEKIKIPGGSE